jgi:IPT/TIG domain-containing protein
MRKLFRHLQAGVVTTLGAAFLAAGVAHADPVITGLSRDRAPLMSVIGIYGTDLGEAQGSNYVLVGGHGMPILAWSSTVILFLLNPQAWNQDPLALDTAYPVQVVKRADGKTSNSVNLTITSEPPFVNPPGPAVAAPPDQPSINGFQATEFCVNRDQVITIYGAGFAQSLSGYVSVTIPFLDSQGHPFTQEFALPVLLWSENALDVLFRAPAGAQLGTYTLTVHRNNGKSASKAFTVVNCTP